MKNNYHCLDCLIANVRNYVVVGDQQEEGITLKDYNCFGLNILLCAFCYKRLIFYLNFILLK